MSICFSTFIIFLLTNCFLLNTATAQNKAAARYEIDAKRIGVSPVDKDALPRSREFIRLDSTYYVGWMYEGIYKFDRSADYLGFKYALPSLEKAFNLMEKDYGDKLKNIYSSFSYYEQYRNRMADFFELAYALEQSYNSIEMPDSTMALLDRIESYHFQKDYFSIYNERAWIFHRNRFFTSEKFKFLKNSVDENESMAFQCCYYQLALIEKGKPLNDYWYGPHQSEDDILGVEHNLALLHCYNQNYDSAEYYYQRLIEGDRILWGNYAGMQHEIGNIDSSIAFYAKPQNIREHSLSESDYFMPSLFIYGGRTKEAIQLVQDKIASSGSTPGFGWYNIALGRSYLYDGQLDSAEFFLNKAANFKELHLNTTLTQSQYEFTINLLKVQLLGKRADQVKFLNKGWWYSFSDLFDIISLKVQKLLMEYVVVNELANNPERKRIVYDLFCGESTVTYDEIMYLLEDFSTPYFREKYNSYIENDKRKNIKRYFQLLAAKLRMENGDKKEAAALGENLLKTVFSNTGNEDNGRALDTANEKLFLARLYELLAATAKDKDSKYEYDTYRNNLLEEFPQMIPFSNIPAQMRLTVSGTDDDVTKKVISDLKDCNIDWITGNESSIPEASITFDKKGKTYQVVLDVKSGSGKPIVSNGQMLFKTAEGAGQELGLRIFAKGGGMEFEQVKEEQKPLP